MHFQTPLLPWATRLGINGRPDTIRRALDAPHRQLIACRFLQDVHYLGRGKAQQVQYVFAQTERPPARPEAVAALTSRRITQGAALKYAAEYGLEAVQSAVRRFDELLAAGYKAKSASGLLVDILRDPQKYQVIDAPPPVTRPAVKAVPAEPEPPEPEERSLHTARFLLRKVTLPDAVKDQAAELYLQGHVTAAQLAALSADEDAIRTVLSWSGSA